MVCREHPALSSHSDGTDGVSVVSRGTFIEDATQMMNITKVLQRTRDDLGLAWRLSFLHCGAGSDGSDSTTHILGSGGASQHNSLSLDISGSLDRLSPVILPGLPPDPRYAVAPTKVREAMGGDLTETRVERILSLNQFGDQGKSLCQGKRSSTLYPIVSLLNHADTCPNCILQAGLIVTVTEVSPGDELCISYGESLPGAAREKWNLK